ncbi:MAG: hypothetical protein FJZ43_03725 [Candidatus Staskawiczbacteria bacterium]|nr:hypothetical protein [Candidatus Staskawiczbacteria bacterium]
METNEFLGFIIAIIGIVLLGLFGFKLYGFFVDQDMKNAKAFVDDLTGKIDLLKDGENNTFALRGRPGWILVGWNKEKPIALEGEVISKDRKPQKCFENSCICLCEGSISKCQEVGYCKNVDGDVNLLGQITYTGGNSEGVYTSRLNSSCIIHENGLMDIFVSKKNDFVFISYDYGQRESEWVSENKVNGAKLRDGPYNKLENECFISREILGRS